MRNLEHTRAWRLAHDAKRRLNDSMAQLQRAVDDAATQQDWETRAQLFDAVRSVIAAYENAAAEMRSALVMVSMERARSERAEKLKAKAQDEVTRRYGYDGIPPGSQEEADATRAAYYRQLAETESKKDK